MNPFETTNTSCPSCGGLTNAGDVFCMHCGASLRVTPQTRRSTPAKSGFTSLWASADRRVIRIFRNILLVLNGIGLVTSLLRLLVIPRDVDPTLHRIDMGLNATLALVFMGILASVHRAPAPAGIAYLALAAVVNFYVAIAKGGFSNGLPAAIGTIFGIALGMCLLAALVMPIIRRGFRLQQWES